MPGELSAEIRGRSVLILGYGREGRAVHRYLLSRRPETAVAVADRAPVQLIDCADAASTAIYSGGNYLQEAAPADTIIRSPGLSPLDIPAVLLRKSHTTTLTNIFFSHVRGRVVGVTGTKGKSTTVSLIHSILSGVHPDVRLVGNIGLPALDFLDGADERTVFVCELSSFQLEDLRYSPDVSVLLSVYPEHLDHHGTFQAYKEAKLNIARRQSPAGRLVLSREAKGWDTAEIQTQARKTFFSAENGANEERCFIRGGKLILRTEDSGEYSLMTRDELPVIGPGNLQNVLAAISAASLLSAGPENLREGVLKFKPLAHRLEFAGEYSGIRFYNDSLSTIPQAAMHALDALAPDVACLILGGHDRGVDFTPLGPAVLRHGVQTLILLPNTGERIWKAVQEAGEERLPQKFFAGSLEEAVGIAFRETPRGKICLLSPASSSLNMFRDYQERGEKFKTLVARGRLGGQ